MPDISKHPILRQISELMHAIEVCGASPELTKAVCLAEALYKPAEALVDSKTSVLENFVPGGAEHITLAATLAFGQAIEAVKAGQRITRASWNGKGMFVYLVPAASYPVQTGAAKAHFGPGAIVPYNRYLAIKGVDETVSTWVPSVSDCLAEDWHIVATS